MIYLRLKSQAISASILLCFFILSSCTSNIPVIYQYPTTGPDGVPTYKKQDKITTPDWINFLSFGKNNNSSQYSSAITVNAFLWRATLDTLSFLPLDSADPFGGVIISDWYNLADSPEERFKVTVYILDQKLRSDGIRANVFRQIRVPAGNWHDVIIDNTLGRDLENTILTRARQMRIRQLSQ
ncbi:hypothetical protein A1OE_478 [Candidatus Endolissoclinum faulkneri L2]|uniref:DUF3576 domain-containing protein n=1 Tax=Candidatus Endolissoclinum faulkneri L2 TaxID=1193729 RepID=K7ZCK5_9PROT|nr:DUF3576 domain-containing protein [Candidatus Endolissoclinum faulkneri]AFX98671.1 hypothetical protein A1OE_478 [Candidatus Endolissoclinum faulkneri L2]